jgi:hypothetical protein
MNLQQIFCDHCCLKEILRELINNKQRAEPVLDSFLLNSILTPSTQHSFAEFME